MTELDLARRKCRACTPDTPTLDRPAAEKLLGQVEDGWDLEDGDRIRRKFRFRNFRDAFGFATRVALLAEDEGHHPDLEIGWGRVGVSLTTHAARGLTDNDFIMAAKIDRLTS
jgi:4a-hydroxytetrahydrobiopterin dehydratase